MAKVTAKNAIMAKLKKKGIDKIHKAHAADATELGMMDLPAGIKNGVAELVSAELKEYPADHAKHPGLPSVTIQGTILSPVKFGGRTIAGQRVTYWCPLFDFKKGKLESLEDHYSDLLNELRKFGIDTKEFDPDSLGDTLDELVEEAPTFAFSTRGWTGKPTKERPNPTELIFTEFNGPCDFEKADPDGEVDDGDGEEEDDEEAPAPRPKPKKKKATPEPEADDDSEVSVGDTGTASYEGDDFAVVVDVVDGDTLTVHNAEDKTDVWDVEVSEFTADEVDVDDDDEGEGAEAEPPGEGEVRMYGDIEVVVDKVYPKKRTADVSDNENDDVYEGVPWSDLVEA